MKIHYSYRRNQILILTARFLHRHQCLNQGCPTCGPLKVWMRPIIDSVKKIFVANLFADALLFSTKNHVKSKRKGHHVRVGSPTFHSKSSEKTIHHVRNLIFWWFCGPVKYFSLQCDPLIQKVGHPWLRLFSCD